MMLKPSTDRKVANRVTKSGNPGMRNAFGLPAGNNNSCPGATSYCSKICYAGKIERLPTLKAVRDVVNSNFEQLKNASLTGMVDLIDQMITSFSRECDRFKAPKYFRIHWDGDFFSPDYARAWAIVCKAHKDVRFWVYTRSMWALPILQDIPNVALFASADPENIAVVSKLAGQTKKGEYTGLYHAAIAYVDDTDFENPGIDEPYKCPEGRSLALISEKGSACMRCGVCPNTRGNVLFSTGV